MPYIDIVTKDDYASIWYMTNTPYWNVGSFDPEKPTIVMLPPLHLDSTWLFPQLDDPRLHMNYNIIALDTRLTGQSRSRLTGKYDFWVQAADIAHAFHHLQLPPAHIFASEVFSYAALRFAALFPHLCLSLTLCNVPAQRESKVALDATDELCHLWSYADDLETFECSNKVLLDQNAGPFAHPDLQDEIVAWWQTTYPPFRRSALITIAQVCMNRTPMTPSELASVDVPVLIMQADQNPMYPLSNAEVLRDSLVNAPGGARVFSVKSSSGFITIMSASIVNQVFAKFLAQLPHARSDLNSSKQSLRDAMDPALSRLAGFKVDSSILTRDPNSPLSFSCTPLEQAQAQQTKIATYAKGQRKAFSPLGADGRPLRKFSERKDHWLDGGPDGYSYAETKLKPIPEESSTGKRRPKTSGGRSDHKPDYVSDISEDMESPTEPAASTNSVQSFMARGRRIVTGATEPAAVKNSMAKVITGHPSVPLGRMLR